MFFIGFLWARNRLRKLFSRSISPPDRLLELIIKKRANRVINFIVLPFTSLHNRSSRPWSACGTRARKRKINDFEVPLNCNWDCRECFPRLNEENPIKFSNKVSVFASASFAFAAVNGTVEVSTDDGHANLLMAICFGSLLPITQQTLASDYMFSEVPANCRLPSPNSSRTDWVSPQSLSKFETKQPRNRRRNFLRFLLGTWKDFSFSYSLLSWDFMIYHFSHDSGPSQSVCPTYICDDDISCTRRHSHPRPLSSSRCDIFHRQAAVSGKPIFLLFHGHAAGANVRLITSRSVWDLSSVTWACMHRENIEGTSKLSRHQSQPALTSKINQH